MYYTFTRCDKRTFDRAFGDGLPVSIAKDAAWSAEHDTFVSSGFTREGVADPYQDGPSRPGERWSYWVGDIASATTVGPVEFHYDGNSLRGDGVATWRFWCGTCSMWCTFDDRDTAEVARQRNVVAHAGVVANRCACSRHADGSVTTMLCPTHAESDPCETKSSVTGRRRKGTIRRGVCTNCGWGA